MLSVKENRGLLLQLLSSEESTNFVIGEPVHFGDSIFVKPELTFTYDIAKSNDVIEFLKQNPSKVLMFSYQKITGHVTYEDEVGVDYETHTYLFQY